MVFRWVIALVFTCTMTTVFAEAVKPAPSGFQPVKAFFGGGLSSNSVAGSDDGTGFQIFGGYRFSEKARGLKLDGEVGYMSTGDMDITVNVPFIGAVTTSAEAKGLWATAVLRVTFSPDVEGLGRLGLDFGDDDGLMAGVGLGLYLSKEVQLRVEYVERDDVDSLQFNAVVW